ncbi:Asp23/Gls24 family envelope stress response protein [Kribbella sp. NPDC005582]|uniref:Asp23/Gls24 family envelope stress response protein n=1 Tax=Kribbella sp. NPDC005582 TaxID=3156893 RepID=UPI0033B151CF
MEMNPDDTVTALHPLPCGRTVEDVWDELESGELSAHRADCPHCRTAQAGLEQLIEATQLLIDDPVEVPGGLLDRIMTAVRADLNLGRTIPLPTEPAAIEVSVHALAAVLRYAVDGTSGVRARQCRIELTQPGSVAVWMSVALEFGAGQVGALDEARQRVAMALRGQVGLELDTLDFEVVDVWTTPGPQSPGSRS